MKEKQRKVESKFTCQTKSSESEAVEFPTNHSVASSDGSFEKRLHEESPDLYVREKRRHKPRYDPKEWELGSTIYFSQVQSRRTSNTTTVSHASLVGSKAETVETDVHFSHSPSRRTDSTTTVSHVSHMESKIEMVEIDEHCRRLDKVKSVDIHSNISSCTSEIMRVECPHPYEFPKRECTQRSRSSSGPSKRISKATSILPECMMDVTFDHCFRNMWSESPEERRKMCTYLTCYYFNKYALEEHSRDKVLGWINAQNIFSKKYVFVPILLWSHWSLLVFCNLSEGLMSETRTPCMLLLDSLHEYGSPQKLEPLIRSFVLEIFDTGGRPEPQDMVENIPLLVPKVPQQRNDMDCGIFVLYYINMFLKSAPESFIVSDGYPYFMTEDWFTERQVKAFYDKLEALGLQSDEDVVSLNSDSDDGIDEL